VESEAKDKRTLHVIPGSYSKVKYSIYAVVYLKKEGYELNG
jgi:hypothetical protein